MKKRVKPQLPSGFKPISGGGSSWDYKAEPTLEGVLVSVADFESKFKDPATKKFKHQKKAIIRRKDGTEVVVYESAGTRPLFGIKKGKTVAVCFLGMKKIKGRSVPMKDFLVGVK